MQTEKIKDDREVAELRYLLAKIVYHSNVRGLRFDIAIAEAERYLKEKV